jgi:hypothetical protein
MNGFADPDALAAEYVLGTLDADERATARNMLATDEAFAAKVKAWERRLGELHLMVEPVDPDGKIWDRVRAKVPEVPQDAPARPPEPEPAPPAAPAAPSPPPAAEAPVAAPEPAAPRAPFEPPRPPVEPPPPLAEPPRPSAEAAPAAPPPAEPVAAPAPPLQPPPALTPGPRIPPVEPEQREYPEPPEEAHAVAVVRRRLLRWRIFAVLMTLVVLAIAGLVAAWRFAPEHVPPVLKPVEVLRLLGVPLPAAAPGPRPRPPAPPESQFDE